MITPYLFLASILAAASSGFLLVFFLMRKINETKVDNAKAQKIADAIKLGAMTFLREEYKVIAFVVLPVVLLLAFIGWASYLLDVLFWEHFFRSCVALLV